MFHQGPSLVLSSIGDKRIEEISYYITELRNAHTEKKKSKTVRKRLSGGRSRGLRRTQETFGIQLASCPPNTVGVCVHETLATSHTLYKFIWASLPDLCVDARTPNTFRAPSLIPPNIVAMCVHETLATLHTLHKFFFSSFPILRGREKRPTPLEYNLAPENCRHARS